MPGTLGDKRFSVVGCLRPSNVDRGVEALSLNSLVGATGCAAAS